MGFHSPLKTYKFFYSRLFSKKAHCSISAIVIQKQFLITWWSFSSWLFIVGFLFSLYFSTYVFLYNFDRIVAFFTRFSTHTHKDKKKPNNSGTENEWQSFIWISAYFERLNKFRMASTYKWIVYISDKRVFEYTSTDYNHMQICVLIFRFFFFSLLLCLFCSVCFFYLLFSRKVFLMLHHWNVTLFLYHPSCCINKTQTAHISSVLWLKELCVIHNWEREKKRRDEKKTELYVYCEGV